MVDDPAAAKLLGVDFRRRDPEGAAGGVVLSPAGGQAWPRRVPQHRQGERDTGRGKKTAVLAAAVVAVDAFCGASASLFFLL